MINRTEVNINVRKLFSSSLMLLVNKLECLSLAAFQGNLLFSIKAEAYSRGAPVLLTNIRLT